jgi:hypothetical protein
MLCISEIDPAELLDVVCLVYLGKLVRNGQKPFFLHFSHDAQRFFDSQERGEKLEGSVRET